MSGSNSTYYFAYGSNMSASEMLGRAPESSIHQVARLPGYRLAFTRLSKRRLGGVADVIPCDQFSVYGVLWAVSKDGMDALDRAEGVPDAYRRHSVTCLLPDRKIAAITYVVSDPSASDITPSSAYMKTIIEGAKEHHLPDDYIAFLDYLQMAFANDSRGEGLLLAESRDRRKSHGQPIVRLNPNNASGLSGSKFAALRVSSGRDPTIWALGKLDLSTTVESGICEADQIIRGSLGLPSKYCYGHRVEIQTATGKLPGWSPIQPRSLVLSLHSTSRLDSEKNYCVLHQASIRALGLQEGEYVRLYVALPGNARDSPVKVRATSLRVFAGIGTKVQRPSGEADYPVIWEVYVDEDGRDQLGLGREGWVGRPILVRPNIWRAMAGRILFYGVTVLLGISAFFQLLQAFAPSLSAIVQALAALVISAIVTVAVGVWDLRARLRY